MIRFWKVPLCAESESPRPALTHIAKGTITKAMKLWRGYESKESGHGAFQASFEEHCKANLEQINQLLEGDSSSGAWAWSLIYCKSDHEENVKLLEGAPISGRWAWSLPGQL